MSDPHETIKRLEAQIAELRSQVSQLSRAKEGQRRLYQRTPAMLHSIDADYRLVEVNDYWLQVMGYERHEVLGRRVTEFLIPKYRRIAEQERLPRFFEAGHAQDVPGQMVTKSGEIIDVMISATSERDEQGRVLRSLTVTQNVTEQKRAEAALKASEARFRQLVENIKEAFWVRETESGRFQYLSPAVEKVFGLSREFLYENPFGYLEMVLPEDRPILERSLADQRVRGADTDIEYRIQRGDGQVRWIRSHTVCQGPRQDEPQTVLGVTEDITERKQAQLALARSQEKFSLVFRSSPLWVSIVTLENGVYLDVNDTFSEITGFSRQEVMGRSSKEVGIWSDLRRRGEAVELIKQRGALKDFAIDYVTRDGRLRHALWSAEPVTLDGRRCLISVIRDVTRRRLAENALRQANATLELAQKMARLGNWSVEVDSRWPVWSDQMYQITGRDPGQGPPEWGELLEMIHAEDREHFTRMVEESFREGKTGELEVRLHGPEGGLRHLAILAHAQKDAKGRVIRLYGIVQDVTERKRAEQVLRDSEEQYRRLFEHAALGAFQSTVEGRIIRVNPACAAIFGYESPQAMLEGTGRNIDSCYADPSEREQALAQVMADEGTVRLEIRCRRRDGSVFTGLQHVRLARDQEGKPLRLEGFVEDVSQLRESQEVRRALERRLRQAQKLEALGTMAGGLAHDFNNILAVIMGHTELSAADLEPGHPSQESLQKVLASSRQAKELVSQVLSFSRAVEAQPRIIDLNDVLQEALRLLTPELPASVTLECSAGGGLTALADGARVHKVIANLWDNALQAMEGQEGRLSLGLERVELNPEQALAQGGLVPGPYARLWVSDNGMGMAPEKIEHAFEPFFTTREVGEGHGMGLAEVYGIVESHHGSVNLESEPGQGTTVTVLLPLSPGGQEPPEPG